jgi:tetratricopeptide (TPR) repeat protein
MNKKLLTLFAAILILQTAIASTNQTIDSLLTILARDSSIDEMESFIKLNNLLRPQFGSDIDDPITTSDVKIESANFEKLCAQTYELVANKYYEESLYDSAKIYIQVALESYKNLKDTTGMIRMYLRKTNVAVEEAEYDQAQSDNQLAFQLSEFSGNKKLQGKSLVNSGIIYYYSDNYKKALEKFFQTLLIYNSIHDSLGMAFADKYIGIVYNQWGAYEKALDYFNRAELIYRNSNKERELSKVLTNKADVFNFYLSDYSKALELYSESLDIKEKLNDVTGIALLNNNIGTVYGNLGNYPEALKYLLKSKNIYSDFNSQTGLIMTDYNLGNLYLVQKNYEKAISFLKMSLDRANKIGYNEYVSANYKSLITAYAAICDYDGFSEYYALDTHITDSLLNNLNQAEINAAEAVFRATKVIDENIKLKDKVFKQDDRIKRNRLLLAGLVAVFIVLIIVVYVQARTK